MNALTFRTLATFPDEIQSQVRAHAYDDLDELVQQVALELLAAKRSDTFAVIFDRARSSVRRFSQDLAHFSRPLDSFADAHATDGGSGGAGKKKREITREVAADFNVTQRRARQIVEKQVERAEQGDLFMLVENDDEEESEVPT